jgi:benzoylformate decarboxylase
MLEQFLADGIDVMFGNPGTVEQGFLNALDKYPAMKYVLHLQESIAVMAGDGYARSTKRPALVQIHSAPGLGNAIGAIYQAHRGHSPLVIIGGDAGIQYMPMQAQMYADLVAMAAPVTKLSIMVQHKDSLLRVLRRAIKVATTAPMGPVYVCLPADILDMESTEEVFASTQIKSNNRASADDINLAATWLASAKKPRIFIGDGVHYSHGASAAVVALAETLGADIFGVDSGEANVPMGHPLYRGQTGHMFGFHSKPITMEPDVLLVAGTYMVPEVFPNLDGIYSKGARVIHVDLDTDAIAKNHRVDLAMNTDIATSVTAIVDSIKMQRSEAQVNQHLIRSNQLKSEIAAERAVVSKGFEQEAESSGVTMAAFAKELFKQAKNPIVVEEALTNSPPLVDFFVASGGSELIQTRGGSLGMGMASAIGVQTANPNRTVISVSGDGGGMYTVQSLWSAARHQLPIKYVVCSNGTYHLLQLNILEYWNSINEPAGVFPSAFDLSKPELKYDKFAEGMGVPAIRVDSKDQIHAAIALALATPGPFLIDLRLPGEVNPKLIGIKCGQ